MPTIGPYQLLHALGTCQVGDVWSAVDAGNNQVTVAVLKPETASDLALRDAFAAAANHLAQSRQVPIIAGDFSSPTPWIASATSDGSVVAQVFVAIGMTYQPVARSGDAAHLAGGSGAEATQVVHLPPAPTSPASFPAHAAPEPVPPAAAPSAIPRPMPPPPVSSPPGQHSVSSPPGQVSAPPQPMPMPGWAPPLSDASPQDLTPIVVTPPDDGQRRRTGLLIGALVVGILVLGGTGGVIAFVMQPDSAAPPPPATPAASATVPVNPPSEAPPERPGVEPAGGEWPANFATFAEGEGITMAELPGLSFDFTVPDGWDCTDVSSGDGVVRYTCGPGGNADEIGGEIVVRECPDPCDSEQRVTMRLAQDAWGLQWYRDAGYRSWAEAEDLDGESRYALIMLGYTRTSFESRLDRQVVVRLTAPQGEAETIQKVLNSIRGAIQAAVTEK